MTKDLGEATEAELRREIDELKKQKDAAYRERNLLVAALTKIFPSRLGRHPHEDAAWEDDWRWIVFIDLPTGQATWHIHDSEFSLFAHVPVDTNLVWDGHTTEEKYERLAALAAAQPRVQTGAEGCLST